MLLTCRACRSKLLVEAAPKRCPYCFTRTTPEVEDAKITSTDKQTPERTGDPGFEAEPAASPEIDSKET